MGTAILDSPDTAAGFDPDVEVAKCRANPAYLTHNYGIIDNTKETGESDDSESDGRSVATHPFHLWPSQVPVLFTIWSHQRTIILKARQLGISWLVCAYVLWLCLFKPGRVVLIFSKGQRESNEMIRRIRVLHERFPQWLKDRLPALTTDNVREVGWANASNVRAMPATPSAGVSYRADVIILDEAAKGQMAKNGSRLYQDAAPTVESGGGQIIILSTADGQGGFFHTMWNKAVGGLNNFKTVFLPWWSRPGRDAEWYRQRLRDAIDPALVPQNYPSNPLEAFVTSGRVRFNPAWVKALWGGIMDPIIDTVKDPTQRVGSWPRSLLTRRGWPGMPNNVIPHVWELPGLRIFKPPIPGRKYVIVADVAEGKDPTETNNPDYSAAAVVDVETWEEMAALHGRWEPDLYALYLMALAEAFNQCGILVERNNHGHAVLATFRTHKFPLSRIVLGHDGAQGWLTTDQTKTRTTDLLAGAMRDQLVTIHSHATMSELQAYRVLKNGRTGAPKELHDDTVTCWQLFMGYVDQMKANQASSGPPLVGGERPRFGNPLVR